MLVESLVDHGLFCVLFVCVCVVLFVANDVLIMLVAFVLCVFCCVSYFSCAQVLCDPDLFVVRSEMIWFCGVLVGWFVSRDGGMILPGEVR